MAVKKKKESLADQIINGTYEPKFSAKNVIQKRDSIVDRVQQRLNNTTNNTGITARVQQRTDEIMSNTQNNVVVSNSTKKIDTNQGFNRTTTNQVNKEEYLKNATTILEEAYKDPKNKGKTPEEIFENIRATDPKKAQPLTINNNVKKKDLTADVKYYKEQNKREQEKRKALEKSKNGNLLERGATAINETAKDIFQKPKEMYNGYQLGDATKIAASTAGSLVSHGIGGVQSLGQGIADTFGYGMTGVSNLLGKKDAAERWKNATQIAHKKNEEDKNKIYSFTDKNSLFGKSGAGVVEGMGQSLAFGSAGKIGGGLLTFNQGLSNSLNESYSQEDVEDWQAWLKGTGSGLISWLTENTTEVMGYGGNPVDDKLKKAITSKISSGLGKALARTGISATGEAFEEIEEAMGNTGLNYIMNYITDKVGHGAKFDTELDVEQMIEDATISFLSGGISEGGSTYINNVIQSNERINQIEQKNGKELSKEQKKKIREQTLYESEVQIEKESASKKTKERNELIDSSNLGEKSKEQLKRLSEKNNWSVENLRNMLEQGGNLNSNQKQSTTMQNKEVLQNNQQVIQSDTKTAQNGNTEQIKPILQNYLKNAYENGLDVQNKTVKSIYEVTQRRGIIAEYNEDIFKNEKGEVDTNKNAIWTIDENGNRKILINPNANTETTLQNIMVHELTHDFEGSKEYEILSKLALDKMKTQEGYLEARKDLERIYSQVYDKNSKEFQTLVDQEAVANFLGENLGNQEFINELVNSQPRTTIEKIYDWVVDKIAKVTGNEKLYWKNVEQKFKNAYNSQNENSSQDSKYSIGGIKGVKNIKDRNIKGSALKNYQKAQKMAKANIDNKKIFEETGWYKDKVTGKMKFNFSDKDMELISRNYSEGQKYKLKDIIKHDTLFEIYPQLKDYDVKIKDLKKETGKNLNGRYNSLTNELEVDINRFNDKANVEGTLIHEIQHAIQKIEKFANGTSIKFGKDNYKVNPGEKEARDTTRRFLLEKYKNKNLTNKLPKSARFEANILEKMKIGLYNYITNIYEEVNDNEISKYDQVQNKEIEKTTETKNNRPVLGGIENSNKSSFSIPKLKEKQLEIINKSNHMLDDYHLGIRSIEDIKTFDEVINDDESFVYGDFSKEDAEKALKDGKVTVYSSKPIEQGNFVSTSKNMAQDYAGRNGKVYSQEVSLNDVAWINGDEGQYAKVDNTKYSYQSNGAWNDFLKKHSVNKGTGETIQQVKLPQMPIEQFQKVLDTAQHIPQEEKEYLLKSVEDIKRNKTSLEDFKNTVQIMEKAYDEQNENILDTKKTYNTGRREIYQKYMKAKGEYDTSSLDNAKEIIPANKQGRRTKSQWLNIAKQIGTEIADKSNSEIEEIAYRTWQDERPSNKESLNRQGEKFVTFTSDEWINTIYDTVKEQREKYSIDTDNNKGINYFDEDLQAIREASKKGLGDTMTIDEQIEAIQNLDSKELDNKLENTSSKIVDKLSKEKTPFKKRVAEVRRLITNKGAFVDDLFKATGNKQGIWKYDRYLGSFSEGQVSIGVNQINSNGEIVGDSLLDIYENAKKSGITQKILDDYVLNKDNISRSKYEKYIFGEEISAKDSQRIIDEYDKKYPQLKEYAKQVSDYADNNTKGYLVGTFISQDLHNKLRQMYPDHVPVVRDISETPGLAEYDNVGAQVLKRATGGNQEILSPKEALAQQSVTYARAFRRNEALKEVYKSIKSDTKVLYDLGKIIDIEQANDCIKNAISYDDTLNKYTATVFENGEAKVFEISKGIFDAFNNDTIFDKIDRGLENSLPGKVLKKSTETFKGLTTGKNILYALKNMARDINDAPINSTTNFANYMKDWAYAYEQIVTNGKYYQEYVNAGGNSNTFYDYSKGLIKKDFSSLPKKAINFINNQTIGRVEQINEVVETAPRLAEYIATRQRGGSIDEALYNSAEVTTNFKRGGEFSKLVDKYGVPYLNASIQGLSKVYRNVSEAKGFKQYAKLAVNATLAGVLPSVINHLVYDDDDDYEELPDYIKDGYYLIKVTDLPNGLQGKLKKWTENNFVRIPKGRISAVLGGTAVRLHETLNEEGEDVWNGYMSDVVLNNIGINNPLTNNLLSGLIQATRNKAWYGGSIYSETKFKNKLPVEITDEKTTQLSNWIAKTVYNLVGKDKYKQLVDEEKGNAFFKVLATPKLLDYAMDQYSGIVGDIVMPMLTPYAENNALVDQFTTSSTLKSTTVSKFYEIMGNCYQNSEYATDTDKLTYKYLEEVSKEVGGMYAEKSSIQSDSTLTNKQKQQKTYEIQEQINQKMEEAINSVENMKLTNNTANFNGTEYYKDEEGKWKAITDKNKIEGLSSETYANYKNKLATALAEKKKTDGEDAQLTTKERLELLEGSTYSDKEKDEIYSQTTGQKDKVYSNLKKINKNDLSSIDEYLKYKTADFSADKKDDGTKNGKSISGSAKTKVINFINDSNLSDIEKIYLYGTKYKLNNTERNQFAEYVDTLKLSDDEIKELYLTLNGVVEMSDGSIKWK